MATAPRRLAVPIRARTVLATLAVAGTLTAGAAASSASTMRCGDTLATGRRVANPPSCPGGWRLVGAHGPLTPAVPTTAPALDLRSPDARDVAAGRRIPAPPVVVPTPVVRRVPGGFDWQAAAAGALAALAALAVMAVTGAAVLRRRVARRAVGAH
jgi:hypothetical protein